MSAQPKRAPEPEREVPRLRSRTRPRAATAADRPIADEAVPRLHQRLSQAFTDAPPRGRRVDAVIKILIVAATCVCMGEALANTAPAWTRLLG